MNLNLTSQTHKSSPSKKDIPECSGPRKVINAFKHDPLGWLEQFPPTFKKILNTIIESDNNQRNPQLLHKTIADRSGCSIATVKRYLDIMERAGLISRIGRYWRSSIFRVSDFFHQPRNRKLLRRTLKSFSWLPLMFLTVSNGTFTKHYDGLQLGNKLLYGNSLYKKYNSKFFIGNKVNKCAVAQENKTMKLENYPNMSKRIESDNNLSSRQSVGNSKNAWNIPQREKPKQRTYSTYKSGDYIPGSVESDYTKARKRLEAEDEEKRRFEKSVRPVLTVTEEQEIMHEAFSRHASTCPWMIDCCPCIKCKSKR